MVQSFRLSFVTSTFPSETGTETDMLLNIMLFKLHLNFLLLISWMWMCVCVCASVCVSVCAQFSVSNKQGFSDEMECMIAVWGLSIHFGGPCRGALDSLDWKQKKGYFKCSVFKSYHPSASGCAQASRAAAATWRQFTLKLNPVWRIEY